MTHLGSFMGAPSVDGKRNPQTSHRDSFGVVRASVEGGGDEEPPNES
jgi:hypothetical protein